MSVLLVDDDEMFLRATKRGFIERGMAVHVAVSRSLAVELAGEHRPDLMVIDLRIGNECGIELITLLRSRHPGAAIVLLSAYASIASTVAAMRCGADLVLFKPVEPAEILRQVEGAGGVEITEPSTPTLARAEWEHVNRVLYDCNGNVSEAARRLGIYRQSLQRKLRKHAP